MGQAANNMGMSTRRESRVECPYIAHLRRRTGPMQPVTIRDISASGLQGTCFNAPAEGERLSVRFANGRSVNGVVRWIKKGVFGMEFLAPVNLNMLVEGAEHPRRRITDV